MDDVLKYLQLALAAAGDEEGYEEIEDSIQEFITCIKEDMLYIEQQRAETIRRENEFVMGERE